MSDTTVTFRLADPDAALAGVRLFQEVRIPGDQLDFARAGDGWELVIPRPPVQRMEYALQRRFPDGGEDMVLDPDNPRQAPGAFGPKSVLEFPGYQPPRWLDEPAPEGQREPIEVAPRGLDEPVRGFTWAPAGTPDDEPLPLLLAHDGPEFDELASLTRYLAAGVAAGTLPRLRAALLAPGPRDRWYSADPRYTRALATAVLPALRARHKTTVAVGMGASLGALAMLHAHCHYPGALDGLFLQSGSFFRPGLDPQERRFPHWRRIVAFTGRVINGSGPGGGLPGYPVPVAATCGVIEENLDNNRLLAAALAEHGYPAALHEVPDMHNYTAWRDALDPHLTGLLQRVAGEQRDAGAQRDAGEQG